VKYRPDTSDSNYIRDPLSKAVLNIDMAGYERFKTERDFILRQQQLENSVYDLKKDLNEFKDLIKQLINGNTNGKTNS
jgi:hypothetical protein